MSAFVFTDYPFTELGDSPHTEVPMRTVKAISWDGDKYVNVLYNGKLLSVKFGYLMHDGSPNAKPWEGYQDLPIAAEPSDRYDAPPAKTVKLRIGQQVRVRKMWYTVYNVKKSFIEIVTPGGRTDYTYVHFIEKIRDPETFEYEFTEVAEGEWIAKPAVQGI